MWRHKGFTNPYGNEWFLTSCQHQYKLGEAYESGYNDCLNAVVEYLESGLENAKVNRKVAEIEKCLQILREGIEQ